MRCDGRYDGHRDTAVPSKTTGPCSSLGVYVRERGEGAGVAPMHRRRLGVLGGYIRAPRAAERRVRTAFTVPHGPRGDHTAIWPPAPSQLR